MRAVLLSCLLAAAAAAQSAPQDVWISLSGGELVGSALDGSAVIGVGLQAADGPWTARLAYAETPRVAIDLGTAFARADGAPRASAGAAGGALSHRAVVAGVGPRWGRGPATLALTGGPALSWGDLPGDRTFSALGAGGAAQALLQLGGAVWLGAELSGVAAGDGSFTAASVGLRVDLVRAPR